MYCDEHGTIDYCPECCESSEEVDVVDKALALTKKMQEIDRAVRFLAGIGVDNDDIISSLVDEYRCLSQELHTLIGDRNGKGK